MKVSANLVPVPKSLQKKLCFNPTGEGEDVNENGPLGSRFE